MTIQLTEKETMLLEDQKSQEKLCIQKYTNYANQAKDQELKDLFNYYAHQEKQHLNTINQILNGDVPQMNQGQNQQNNQQQNQQPSIQNTRSSAGFVNESDQTLCTDALTTEKYVANAYNTAIFECSNTDIRKALNHIQKEEQEHGEGIFNYLQSHNMYQMQ